MITLSKIPKPNRRWFQFRLRTLFCATTIAAVLFGWPHMHRYYAFWRLQEYLGIELQKLPQEELRQVDRWVARVLGQDEIDPFVSYQWRENWLLYQSNTPRTGQRMYVVQMDLTTISPSSFYCQIHVVGDWGRPIRTTRFRVGGSRAIPQTVMLDETTHGFMCLTVATNAWHPGGTRQFYRVSDNDVEYLRRERMDGTFCITNGNAFDLDDKPPDWSDWEQLLASPDRIEQLRALAAFCTYDDLENLEPVDEPTRLRLEQLSKSRDPWISEEAAAALKLLAKRWPDPTVIGARAAPH